MQALCTPSAEYFSGYSVLIRYLSLLCILLSILIRYPVAPSIAVTSFISRLPTDFNPFSILINYPGVPLYSNEAVNTYIPYNGASYYSNETWRFGVHSTLKLTHRVSLNCGVNLVASDYTRPSSIGNSDTSNLTFNATAGIKLLLTNALALTAQYSYTNGSYSGYSYPMPSYNRNVFSFGVNYSF